MDLIGARMEFRIADTFTSSLAKLAADERTPLIIGVSPGQTGDAPADRDLLRRLGPVRGAPALIMDRAYRGDQTRQLATDLGYDPVVPPPSNPSWSYDHVLYRRRNEVERFCCRLKRFRRIATRYDKLDLIFLSFIHLALIYDALQQLRTRPRRLLPKVQARVLPSASTGDHDLLTTFDVLAGRQPGEREQVLVALKRGRSGECLCWNQWSSQHHATSYTKYTEYTNRYPPQSQPVLPAARISSVRWKRVDPQQREAIRREDVWLQIQHLRRRPNAA